MNIECFVSHSWHFGEHHFAVKLANALRLRGIDTWLDEKKIPGGGHVRDRVMRGVQICDVFLFVMSPAAVISPWCRLELEEALKQRSEIGIQIVPLRLKKWLIPKTLRDLLYIDFRDDMQFEELMEKLLTSIKEAHIVRVAVREVLEGDDETRYNAAQKLAALKNRFTVPIMARRLIGDPITPIEPDPTIRYWLAYALGQIGGEEACAALQKAEAQDTNPWTQQGISEGFQAAGCRTRGRKEAFTTDK